MTEQDLTARITQTLEAAGIFIDAQRDNGTITLLGEVDTAHPNGVLSRLVHAGPSPQLPRRPIITCRATAAKPDEIRSDQAKIRP